MRINHTIISVLIPLLFFGASVLASENPDTVQILIEKSEQMLLQSSDSALTIALAANRIALERGDAVAQMQVQHQIGFIYYNRNNFDLALHHFRISLELAQKSENPQGEALALNRIGNVLHLKTNYLQALDYYNSALELNTKNDFQPEIARTLVNIANAFSSIGQYQRSIEHFLHAMEIHEKTGDREGMAWASLGTARLFKLLGLYDKAMQYTETALGLYRELERETGKTTGVTLCLNELGSVYQKMGNFDRAQEYVKMVLEINVRNGNVHGQASNYMSLGVIFLEKGQNEKARTHLLKALELKGHVGDSIDLAPLNRHLGEVEFREANLNSALAYLQKSLKVATKNKQLSELGQSYFILSQIYKKQGDYKNAFNAFTSHSMFKDSLNASDISKLEMQYEFDKREKEQELVAQQRETFHQMQMERQRVVLIFFVVAFILAIGLAMSVFYAFREKQRVNRVLVQQNNEITRQKGEIEQQKEEIEQQRDFVTKQRDQIAEQQKLITDSILYASRIQNAVLPTRRILEEFPWETFILYKPKNIVSGDFYWSAKLSDGRQLIAVADCTGHGVPGAFMSMLGITLLREIVVHESHLSPSTILWKLREMVIDSLNPKSGQIDQADGMDMAICIIDPQSLTMEYAGAYNPVIIVRKEAFDEAGLPEKSRISKYQNCNILEVRGDKMPVGYYALENLPFTNSTIELQKNDSVYLFTDGIIDQFGGERNTKFLLTALKDLLASIQHLGMAQQNATIKRTIEEFMANKKQVDDMLALGIKIK